MNRAAMPLFVAISLAGCSKTSGTDSNSAASQTQPAAASGASENQSEPEEPPTVEKPFIMPAAATSVDRARYVADLETIAKPRPPGSTHWRAVQDMCAERLSKLGFQVERHSYGTGTNVIGKLPGTESQSAEPWVVLSAHYDSTDDTCPGADDNATGVAGLLESARVLAAARHRRTLIAACWDEEERGLIGSRAYSDKLAEQGQSVAMMYAYEMIGYVSQEPGSQKLPPGFELLYPKVVEQQKTNGQRGDFITLVFDANPGPLRAATAFQRAAASLNLPVVSLPVPDAIKKSGMTRPLRRSDHDSFWVHDMPGMMLTDTANFRNQHYHCMGGPDTVDRLDHDFAIRVVKATVASAAVMLAGE